MKTFIEIIGILSFISIGVFFLVVCFAFSNRSAKRLRRFAIGGLAVSMVITGISTVLLWKVQGIV